MNTIEVIACLYIGFILGLMFHRWMESRSMTDDFWYGFSMRYFIDFFRKQK